MNKIKKFLKNILYLLGYIFRHNRKSKVLYYHDVGMNYTDMGTSKETFLRHINTVRGCGYEIVSEITEPTNQVMIAFDDGWRGLYDNKEILITNKITPTIFIAVDLIGQDGYMTKDQILELMSLGFRFECHTWTHTGLPDHSGEDLAHELKDSKEELEAMFNVPFKQICFPQGRYSNGVIYACKDAGFELMYSSVLGSYYDEYEKGIIRRCFMQDVSPRVVRFVIEGDVPFIRKRDYKNHFVD